MICLNVQFLFVLTASSSSSVILQVHKAKENLLTDSPKKLPYALQFLCCYY